MNSATSSLFMVSSNSGFVSPVLTSTKIYPFVLKAALQENNSRIETTRLIRLAELSYGRRDFEALKQIANLLAATEHGQDAGLYYLALIEQVNGNLEEALTILEPLTRYASPIFRGKAIMSYAATKHLAGDLTAAAFGYSEALRASHNKDSANVCTSLFQLSLIKSQAGDHRASLEILERAWPFVRLVSQSHPHLFYWFHNDLSYELAETGRIDQAREHSKIASRSPLIDAYPEIHQTSNDIEEKAQSAEHKPVVIVIEQKLEPELQPKPAVVLAPVICFQSLTTHDINLHGSLYLSRAPASIFQRERIRYSITRRGPPPFLILL